MNNIGIIAEYNPFHNGHLHHLNESKKLGDPNHIIAVMSGDFTQRGEPAMYDNWIRAEMAVKNGVDLVIELPFAFACNNAEYFALGGLNILYGLGCVTHFSFGSESGDLNKLIKAAEFLAYEDPNYQEILKGFMDKGFSYPRSRSEALKSLGMTEVASLVRDPNNILAVEYLKQWIRLGRKMEPITIKRMGNHYHDNGISCPLASATAIRREISGGSGILGIKEAIPKTTAEIMDRIERKPIIDSEGFFDILIYKILTSANEELAEVFSAGEGLENRLKKAIIKCRNVEELIDAVLSKRYTRTRIRRLLLHILTCLTKESFSNIIDRPALYARVLGFSDKGAKLLRHINQNKCSKIPIITNINKEPGTDDPVWTLLRYDVLASDIYNLIAQNELYSRSDYRAVPYFENRFSGS